MDDKVQLSLEQFAGAWGLFCRVTPGGLSASEDGIEYRFSGLPVSFFNVAIPMRTPLNADGLRTAGERAVRWAAPAHVPWLFLATHEWLAPGVDAPAALGEAGLAPVMTLTGMRAARVGPVEKTPEGLALTLPADDAGCAAMVNVNAAAYEMPGSAGMEALGTAGFWNGHTCVVGQAGGAPASCAGVLMVGGLRYVAFVATLPGHQRKGYAGAVMRLALSQAAARHGETPSVLHATEAGKPVYERMGYETISTHTLYMEKRFLEGH